MKTVIMMATMMLAAVMTASAQARFDEGTFTLQPRIGATGALFTNTPSISFSAGQDVKASATAGIMIGVDAEYYLTDRVSVAGGIGLMQAGTGWKNFTIVEPTFKTGVKDMKIETAYFNIPITANWYVAKGLALKAGVQAAFLTKGEMKATAEIIANGGGITKTEVNEGCKDDLTKFDLSIPVGLSYEFEFPLVIDARYNIGLTKVNKDSDPGEKDSRNMVFMLSLGYKFQL